MSEIAGYEIEQNWSRYSDEAHAIRRFLFERQQQMLVGRACRGYLEGLRGLDDPRPHRVRFDLPRVMRTRYRIDRDQETYFVIDDFDQLFAATKPDFAPIYPEIARLPEIAPGRVLPGERLYSRRMHAA